MSWVKIDDQYPDHPKVVSVGPLGLALHVAATCYCSRYLTDGFIPAAIVPRLLSLDSLFIISSNGVSNAVTHKLLTDELTRVGLLEIVDGGFNVHDYLKYNPSAEEVKAARAENAQRQADYKKKRKSNAVSNAVSNALKTPPPSPSPSSPAKKEFAGDAKASRTNGSDPRSKTPAIILIHSLTGKYPSKVNYDEAIEKLGDSPDGPKATECYRLWTKGGRNPIGLGWLDWYANGIPPAAYGPQNSNMPSAPEYNKDF